MKPLYFLFTLLAGAALLTACDHAVVPPTAKAIQADKAAAAANSIAFSENAEIDNIKQRLELTANPGLLGFVVLLNEMGQPVMHVGVKGKITSGSKRLTKPYEFKHVDCGQYSCSKDVPASSDEGTYGSSGDYIFFWTTDGQYIQWNGRYLYSDKPFRLTTPALVVTGK